MLGMFITVRDDQAAGEERREVPADRAHERVQRQAGGIAEHQAPLGQALGARGDDVGLVAARRGGSPASRG